MSIVCSGIFSCLEDYLFAWTIVSLSERLLISYLDGRVSDLITAGLSGPLPAC